MATENIASVFAAWLFGWLLDPLNADSARGPPGVAGAKDSIDASLPWIRAVTWSGDRADEGATRANSSLSLRGFSTIPTTVRRWASSARVEPSSSRRSLATPSVTATSCGPVG